MSDNVDWGSVGVDAFDQAHAEALQGLRDAQAFYLVALPKGQGILELKAWLLCPEGDTASRFMHAVVEVVAEAVERLEADEDDGEAG